MSLMCSVWKLERAQIQDGLMQLAEVQICLLALHTSHVIFFLSK